MNWRRIETFFSWLLACVVLAVTAFMLAIYGDCFESQACNDFKDSVHVPIIAGALVIWLIGVAFLFRRWTR